MFRRSRPLSATRHRYNLGTPLLVLVVGALIAAATSGLPSSGASFSSNTGNQGNSFEVVSVTELLAESTWWLDATDTTSVYADTGCTTPNTTPGVMLGCWADTRDNGHAIVSVYGNKPYLSTRPINDLRSIRLDNGALRGPDLLGGSSTDTHIYMVSRENWRGNQFVLSLNGDDTTNNNRYALGHWWDGTSYFDPGSLTPNRSVAKMPAIGVPTLFDGFKDSAEGVSGHRVNNGAVAYSAGDTAAPTSGGLQLGKTTASHDIGEVIVFPRRLSSFEDGLLREYLYNKWALGVDELLSASSWWLDASYGSLYSDTACTTASTTNGAPVKCWADFRKNGNQIVATSTNNPVVHKNTTDALKSVRFDGGSMAGPDIFGASLANAQIFMVLRENTRQSNRAFSLNGSDFLSTEAFAAHLAWTDGKTYFDSGDSWTGRSSNIAPALGTKILFNGWKDATAGTSGHQLNRGVKAYSTGDPPGQTVGGLLLGYTLHADVDEFVVFDRRLTPAEEAQVLEYLAHKWSVS